VIACWLSAPVLAKPSPSRTMREKESTTRKPRPSRRAINSRQLFVPRSNAAKRGCAPRSPEIAACGARPERGRRRNQLCKSVTPGSGKPKPYLSVDRTVDDQPIRRKAFFKSERSCSGQNLVGVAWYFHLGPDARDLALGVDKERSALNTHVLAAIHALLDPHAVAFEHRLGFI
jgi:hypothetical protein